jgi:6-phosphogluconolactonase
VIFLVKGKEKAEIVRRIAHIPKPTIDLPASLVEPDDGKLVWMLDREAASGVVPSRRHP